MVIDMGMQRRRAGDWSFGLPPATFKKGPADEGRVDPMYRPAHGLRTEQGFYVSGSVMTGGHDGRVSGLPSSTLAAWRLPLGPDARHLASIRHCVHSTGHWPAYSAGYSLRPVRIRFELVRQSIDTYTSGPTLVL